MIVTVTILMLVMIIETIITKGSVGPDWYSPFGAWHTELSYWENHG
jgi:hypothetical protein